MGPWRTPEEAEIARRPDSCPYCGAASDNEGELLRWKCCTHVWRGKTTRSKECQERAALIPVPIPGVDYEWLRRPLRIVIHEPSRTLVVYQTLHREAEFRTPARPDRLQWQVIHPDGVVVDRITSNTQEVPEGARLRLEYWQAFYREKRPEQEGEPVDAWEALDESVFGLSARDQVAAMHRLEDAGLVRRRGIMSWEWVGPKLKVWHRRDKLEAVLTLARKAAEVSNRYAATGHYEEAVSSAVDDLADALAELDKLTKED